MRRHLKALDPDHPIAVIESPRAPAPAPSKPDRPLLPELSDPPHAAALTAPLAPHQVAANAADVAVSTRLDDALDVTFVNAS